MIKRLGIIYHSSLEDERSGFVEHSRKIYDEVIIIYPQKVVYEYQRESTEPLIWMEGISLNNLSMVYFLEYEGCTNQQVFLLLSNLEKEGCPLSTSVQRFANCYSGVADNIGKCHELLQTEDSGTRTISYVIPDEHSIDQILERAQHNQDFPLIYKPINGLGGRGIIKLNSIEQARNHIAGKFKSGAQIVLLERFMMFAREWRVYIADGQTLCAYEKTGLPNKITRNLSRGGSMHPVGSDFAQVQAFVDLALPADCQLGLYGVDIGLTKRGQYHLIEINTIFLYRHVFEVTRVDLPLVAVNALFKRAR